MRTVFFHQPLLAAVLCCLFSPLVPQLCWAAPDLDRELGHQPLRLFFRGGADGGEDCERHGQPSSRPEKKEAVKRHGPPRPVYESEHRPVPRRAYSLSNHRRRADVTAVVRRPDGSVFEPELQLGYSPRVAFATPFGDGPAHGPHSVYVVEQGIDEGLLTIRTAKWITMHHNCGWGHDGKFDSNLIHPQPLADIPFEIVVDKLWDRNFHLGVASGDIMTVTVLSYGKPLTGARVTLATEQGWRKEMISDKHGKAVFQLIRDYYPPLWKLFNRGHRGELLLTASYTDEQQGRYRDENYRGRRFLTTLPWLYTTSQRDYASYAHGILLVLAAMVVSGLGVFFYRERRTKSYRTIHFHE